jgi:pimeloyl-ACP methyl ester carboxylesterase
MSNFEYAKVSLHYREYGQGYPVLLLAPGGMRSNIEFWQRTPYDPTVELASQFRLIAMDQRNAGKSVAPISASDGWHVYVEDQLRLLDHLGIERCHVLGNCIGGAFALALAEAAPERITAAVLQQPIGRSSENRETFDQMFDGWAEEQKQKHPSLAAAAWSAFRENMYAGDFVFAASRDAVARCAAPLLVLMGNDIYHPSAISREIAELAPQAELVERWKEPEIVPKTIARVREFLIAHTPPNERRALAV